VLENNVYIVAGGGRGIGEATAKKLAELGAAVVVNDLGTNLGGEGESMEPAEDTAQAIRDSGGEATAHFGDIASLDYTETLVEDTYDEYGRIDGAVNFAGVLADGILYKMSGEEWDRVIRVHLRGHFALLRNLTAHWREQSREYEDGLPESRSFVGISSYSATRGNIGQANYTAAKAGILALVRSAAREMSRHNVRVNAFCPNAYTRMAEDVPEEQRAAPSEIASPEDNANFVAYLMSDHTSHISGSTFALDGAEGDELSFVTEGEKARTAVNSGGWSVADLVERLDSELLDGFETDRTDPDPYGTA
jgi:NAD(P)-dependent dehydrogenase (short-subunit alcohol dehydrogenase family)